MRTILSGRVKPQHLADADLLAGISPTSFILADDQPRPATDLDVEVYSLCPMLDEDAALVQRAARMVVAADALIYARGDERLLPRARQLGLAIYEAT